MNNTDASDRLQQQVQQHISHKRRIVIKGGDSKSFYGRQCDGQPLDVTEHHGIISYEPTELVIKARCGTHLDELNAALDEHGQMLAFEPPHFSETATLGGSIATGLSGPARPFAGAARDFVLGTSIINGHGEICHFGGEVMKNVAGYDISRLMTGSLGTLGVILDVSLKTLPKPETELTIYYELTEHKAISRMNKLCNQPLPISATCFDGDRLYIRLSGTASGVRSAQTSLGGEAVKDSPGFWKKIREHQNSFFNSGKPLWRLSLAATSPPLELGGKQLIEWRGAQRWLLSDLPANTIRDKLEQFGGHATLFRHNSAVENVFHPLSGKLRELHMTLKLAMDPHCLFNIGKMYLDF